MNILFSSVPFTIFFVFGIVMFIAIFSFVMMMMFGTKTRSKMLSRQLKSLRDSTDMSKGDIENLLKNLSDASISSKKKIYEEREDDLKDLADANARINKDAIKETSRAVKEGFVGSSKYCKYCGTSIDDDSVFCKSCGKKQG